MWLKPELPARGLDRGAVKDTIGGENPADLSDLRRHTCVEISEDRRESDEVRQSPFRRNGRDRRWGAAAATIDGSEGCSKRNFEPSR